MKKDMNEKKDMLRKAALAARRALDKQAAQEKSHIVAGHIVALPAFIRAETIFAYHAFPSELDVSPICEAAAVLGKRVAFPVWGESGVMVASLSREPSQIIAPEDIDLVIVPCVAFDRNLMRIGWGKGYYDRYLPKCVNSINIAVAFEEQRVETIPSDPWDIAMDAVITDAGVYGLPL